MTASRTHPRCVPAPVSSGRSSRLAATRDATGSTRPHRSRYQDAENSATDGSLPHARPVRSGGDWKRGTGHRASPRPCFRSAQTPTQTGCTVGYSGLGMQIWP
jgi:hypothetical protein